MIRRNAGGGAGDPARTVDHLLAQVVEKIAVVFHCEVSVIELADDGDVSQLLFKLKPHQSQLADQLLGERVRGRLKLRRSSMKLRRLCRSRVRSLRRRGLFAFNYCVSSL